jgi:hypothetical protein
MELITRKILEEMSICHAPRGKLGKTKESTGLISLA